jgi:hypothetical protein
MEGDTSKNVFLSNAYYGRRYVNKEGGLSVATPKHTFFAYESKGF